MLYKDLERFSNYIGIEKKSLIEAFEIEVDFHKKMVNEISRDERLRLYADVYTKVHRIYQNGTPLESDALKSSLKVRKARLFKREIKNHSLLEVGCGKGLFLMSLVKLGLSKNLCGMDVTVPGPEIIANNPEISFIKADITKFGLDTKFDVVYSNHVFEHMALADVDTHLSSIYEALKDNGVLVINVPNRLFGPSDVTRIIDFSGTNKIPAQGTHLNETTYTEIIDHLKAHGFTNFRTTFPSLILRHLVPSFRMSADFMVWLENSPRLISLLYGLRFRGKCVASLEVTIICDKGKN